MTLPKFLLAWSDFNWLWIYAKLRPAQNARWSLLHTLGLTALAIAVGAMVGSLLALLLNHQFVGWLPWLAGLAGGCAGLCWFGVTGLCWNQRATLLRANPAQPVGLPRSRYAFFRCCVGFFYFVVLGLVTPFALMVTVENIRGEITWNRERARLVAAGEKFSFDEILGPAIPAEQNAGAAAVFAPFFDYRLPGRPGSGENLSVVWSSSNAMARFDAKLELPDKYLPASVAERKKEPQTPAVNLNDWSAAFRTKLISTQAVEFTLPEPGNAARDVLAGLAPSEPLLSEICSAAALPRSRFPVHYDESFDALLAHLAKLKVVQRNLELRCAAHLEVGENNLAFADATNALNVAELLREEPLLISQLVRYAQVYIAVQPLWEGLARHRWSDAQLAEFQRRLVQIDYLPGMSLAFEGERAGGIECVDQMIRNAKFRSAILGDNSPFTRAFSSIPRGMLRQNQTALAHFETAMITAVRRGISNSEPAGLTALVQADDVKIENLMPTVYSPYKIMVGMLVPATGRAIEKAARAQTLVRLAMVACALERYRLAHENFPDTLAQLSPPAVGEVPHDPMVNQPFHYQRTDDGWYLLYSVGLNGKDDGGAMRSTSKEDKEDKEEKDWPWPVPSRPEKFRLF